MKNHYINEGSENERLETVQTIGESSTQGFYALYPATFKDF